MIREPTLCGYLLEEALAWLLRGSAYELLVSAEQDPEELIPHGRELRVRGRGTTHQVDVLGEFAFTPAFSLPVRLFLEAKFYSRACGIEVARNAFGVIQDVNQNYVTDSHISRPRRRFQYCYSLFSTSGFTQDTQDYALAHQISLIDLSGESYQGLRSAVSAAARTLRAEAVERQISVFPVTLMRRILRSLLGTADVGDPFDLFTNAAVFSSGAEAILHEFANELNTHIGVELLLGFPAAPFILPLATRNKSMFLGYASAHPSHRVNLRRTGSGAHAEWIATPYNEPGRYELHFILPQRLEDWVSENEESRRLRTSTIKNEFLPNIMVYYLQDGIRACQLKYEPGQLRRY